MRMIIKKLIKLAATIVALTAFVAPAYAEGDPVKGEKIFKKCIACHKVGEKAKKAVGPPLNNIFGQKAAQFPKFKYSKLLKGAADLGFIWTPELMSKYLDKKGMNKTLKAFIKEKGGTPKGKSKMAFVGLKKETQRADVIAYLMQFSKAK